LVTDSRCLFLVIPRFLRCFSQSEGFPGTTPHHEGRGPRISPGQLPSSCLKPSFRHGLKSPPLLVFGLPSCPGLCSFFGAPLFFRGALRLKPWFPLVVRLFSLCPGVDPPVGSKPVKEWALFHLSVFLNVLFPTVETSLLIGFPFHRQTSSFFLVVPLREYLFQIGGGEGGFGGWTKNPNQFLLPIFLGNVCWENFPTLQGRSKFFRFLV